MKKVLICGTSNQDIIGGKKYFGGAGGGIALNLAREMDGVGILTVLGKDSFSKRYLNEFKRRQVNLSLVNFASVKLSTITVVSSENNESARVLQDFGVREIFQSLRPDPKKLNNFDWLHVGGTPPLLCDYLAKNFKRMISYCPGSTLVRDYANLSLPLLQAIDFLFCNEEEYEILQKKVDINKLFSRNLKMICHTQGEKGLIMHLPSSIKHLSRVPARKYVDSTGAGDAVSVGFISEVMKGKSYEEGLQEGLKLASLVIEQQGVVLD